MLGDVSQVMVSRQQKMMMMMMVMDKGRLGREEINRINTNKWQGVCSI